MSATNSQFLDILDNSEFHLVKETRASGAIEYHLQLGKNVHDWDKNRALSYAHLSFLSADTTVEVIVDGNNYSPNGAGLWFRN